MLIVCWDYDGTLVSSELIYKNIFINYLKKNGYVLKDIEDEYYFSRYAGKHPFTVLEQLKSDGYIDKNTVINVNELNLIFQDELERSNDLLLTSNILEVLRNIKKNKNIIMAIVTSTYRIDFEAKFNNPAVKDLKEFFDIDKNVYICGEVGTKKLKPDPNGYLFAYNDIVKKFDIENKNNCLVSIEDSISGCKSGADAKKVLNGVSDCKVIGYIASNNFTQPEDLKNVGADYIIKTPLELTNIINNLAREY